MLALTRNFQQAPWQHNLADVPGGWGTTLTAHATPHSKGAWGTLMTTTYDVYGFYMGVASSALSATRTDTMLDIAIGPTQENIIIPEFLCGWRGSVVEGATMYYFPIFIPRGTLISGRIQALITVHTARILIFANAGTSGFNGPLFSGCDAYGTAIASSIGTAHTPGNSGAESIAANIGGTASKHYGAVMLSMNGTLGVLTTGNLRYHWELVVGGITCCEWFHSTSTAEYCSGPYPLNPFHLSIPVGTQLQIRAECSVTAQEQDVAFYLFY